MEHPHFGLRLLLLHITLLTNILNLIPFAESASHHVVVLKNETDRLALLAFKDGIYDDPNQVLSSWNDSFHFCTWVGVTCSRRHPQRVTTLNLTGQNLGGSLSPHIGNLSFLMSINLSSNNFQGHIPYEMGHLFRLHFLDLHSNSFFGEIPINLTNCLELRLIRLRANNLFGKIPSTFSSQHKLQGLDLGKNNLTGLIPPSLGNLSSLTFLYLSLNKLHGSIPDDINRILNLEVVTAYGNELSGMIPPFLYNHSSITTVDFGDNNLHGRVLPKLGLYLPNLEWFSIPLNQLKGSLPNSLGNASKLWVFDLGDNYFTGPVPMNLGRLQGLKWLNLDRNQLTGDLSFIQSLTNCTWLEFCSLGGNKLQGMLPNSIANFSIRLKSLILYRNQIFGTIPKGICNLASLNVLSLSTNLLTGTIPNQLAKLHKLESIELYRNRLSGQIPESLGNLSRLSHLYLEENDLQGGIPLSLGNCQNLLELNLSNNNLSGSIPEQVLNAQSLLLLDMGKNSLNGALQFNEDKLKNLVLLDVSNNKLSGEIPSMLGSCLNLVYLIMEGNMFQGSIPSSFSALKGIQMFDLAQNNLSGQIPKFLEILPQLRFLNLSFNNLEGEVPMYGIFQNPKAFFILGNARLCGGIPTLKLPSCPKQASKKNGKDFPHKSIIWIVVPTSLGVFLLLISMLVACYCLKRQCGRSTSRSPMIDFFLDVTYAEILRATDGFSLANLIGEGSYGCVYKGFMDRIEKTVAVKVLKLQRQRASKSFKAECKALISIRHRNVVKILTVCSSIDFSGNDFKAFVFEYMPNGNLDMWLHPNANGDNQLRNLDFAQRMNIAIDVACALDYLHHHCYATIVHCDLKPSNILLDNDMVAHVSDFGLARILEDVAYHIRSSSLLVKGSIGYAAPEYGMGSDVSLYGDVYSYGILLLELFTGKKPTDDMFKDNLSLHQFAKMALPDRVMEIIDHRLLPGETEVFVSNKLHECLTALVNIGVSCSAKLPKERMETKDILKELERMGELYLGRRKNQNIRDRASLLVEGPSYLANY